ncbi:MAG: UDP-2,3-diacylglucosamine diphosphatase [Burkholderiaceae bacterium]
MFASDVHLNEHDPATADFFFASLAREARDATHVFLLGDLFEAWIGDDQPDTIAPRAEAAFAAIAAGTRLFVMRGNRDFLLDAPGATASRFSDRAGARMLDDPSRILLFGHPTLLSHGDAWCVDDERYQMFRLQSRDPDWQQAFVRQPIAQRLAIARQLRDQSEREKRDKAAYLMDVNATEILRAVADQQVDTIIHGHTHRPARHEIDAGGRRAVRWVLPDWDGATRRGGFLRVTRDAWTTIGW